MSAGFGFSVGDVVLGLKLIKQSIEAIEDARGSSADYQALSHEIDSLKDGLEAVEDLRLDYRLGPKSKACIAVRDAVSRCRRCIDVFVSTITKFQPWLRPNESCGSAWKANLRKIQWALCKKDDVNRFRSQLERHSSSISMLLVTLQVSQSFEQSARQQRHYQTALGSQETQVEVTTQKKFNQTTALLLGLSLEQRQLFQSLIESNRQLVSANERMAYELGQMRSVVQLQMEIPPQVHLQKPVIFLDACGKVSAFYLDFITCSEALLAVLKIRFQQHGVRERGLKMLDDSQFILEDHRGTLDLSKDWSQVLRPNQKINMSMVFHRDIPCSVCPACRSVNDNALALSIECFQCGLFYQQVETETFQTNERRIQNIPTDSSHDEGSESKEDLDDEAHVDIIDQFRRVQLICRKPSLRTFTCTFGRYGCTSTFRTKNEWKRHVASVHLRDRVNRLVVRQQQNKHREHDNRGRTYRESSVWTTPENTEDEKMDDGQRKVEPGGTEYSQQRQRRFPSSRREYGMRRDNSLRGKRERQPMAMSAVGGDEQPLAPQAEIPNVEGRSGSPDFIDTIRDVADFAWALTGINDSSNTSGGAGEISGQTSFHTTNSSYYESNQPHSPPSTSPSDLEDSGNGSDPGWEWREKPNHVAQPSGPSKAHKRGPLKSGASGTQHSNDSRGITSNSPFHLFDMSAALLSSVEDSHRAT